MQTYKYIQVVLGMNTSWKKIIGVGLSVFILSLGSVGLTGCEAGDDELETDTEELEVEED